MKLTSPSDVDKIIKLALLLQDEAGEIIENQIIINREKGLERLKKIEVNINNNTNKSINPTTSKN